MENEIKTVEYLGLTCKVISRNNVNYYKVSSWCKQINGSDGKTTRRDYSNWKRNKLSKEQIKYAKKKLGIEEVEIEIESDGVSRSIKGIYVYENVAILIAMWIDTEFGFRVADLVNQGIRRELKYKYKSLIREKDDKIDELKRQLDEVLRDTKQVLRDNQVTHSKLEETNFKLGEAHVKLDQVQEELVETKTEREEISSKLDVVTDMLSDLAVNTVPTDGWNKFAVYKVSSSKYKAVRCRNSAYEKQVIRSIPSGSRCIYETDVPNGIEYFATFKEEYARNKDKCRNIVSVSYNDISLKSVNEEEFINILHQHRKRIDEMLEEAQANQDTVIPK